MNDGKIKGRTVYGKETIIVYELNRKDLRRERQEIRNYYVRKIKEALSEYSKNRNNNELIGALKSVFRDLKKNRSNDSPHSLFQIYIYRYFDYFICSFLPEELRGKINKYFTDFINN